MTACVKRLRKDIGDVDIETRRNSESIVVSLVNDDLTKWKIIFNGQKNSSFEGGVFSMHFTFPKEYPFKPPKAKMDTKIYHPNISEGGEICIDLLKDQWSPTISIYRVISSIKSLLVEPNPSDPLNPDAARRYKNDVSEYNRIAREWTLKYAVV